MNQIIVFNSDFIEKNIVLLENRRFNHIVKIHKADIGKKLKLGLFNGDCGYGTVKEIDDSNIRLEVTLDSPPPPPLPVKLIIGLPRPKVFKRIIQYVTTLGVKEIYFINTWKVEKSFWQSPLLNKESVEKNIVLGLEQGCDTISPKIHFKNRFKPFVEDEIPLIIENSDAIVAHPGSIIPCPHNIKSPVTIAIGPEGGFTDYEIELLSTHGFKKVCLTDRILRVETAIPFIIGKLF